MERKKVQEKDVVRVVEDVVIRTPVGAQRVVRVVVKAVEEEKALVERDKIA